MRNPRRVKLPDFIRLAGEPPPLKSLVIGGFAVGVHGFTRPTFDVDLLIRRPDLEAWKQRLSGAGLLLLSEQTAFAQFSPGEGEDGLDLMMVNEETFQRTDSAAVAVSFDGIAGRVVSLDHLLALKLHVLRQALPRRTGKDARDVEELLRRNRVPLDSDHYRNLVLRYGDPNSARPSCDSQDAVLPADGPEEPLELPVDPGFHPESPTVPLQVLMARSADLRRWMPQGIPTEAERLAAKCNVPFTL